MNYLVVKISLKKKVKKTNLLQNTIKKPRYNKVLDFIKKLLEVGLGDSKEAKIIRSLIKKLSLKDNKKAGKGKEKKPQLLEDSDPGPSRARR